RDSRLYRMLLIEMKRMRFFIQCLFPAIFRFIYRFRILFPDRCVPSESTGSRRARQRFSGLSECFQLSFAAPYMTENNVCKQFIFFLCPCILSRPIHILPPPSFLSMYARIFTDRIEG